MNISKIGLWLVHADKWHAWCIMIQPKQLKKLKRSSPARSWDPSTPVNMCSCCNCMAPMPSSMAVAMPIQTAPMMTHCMMAQEDSGNSSCLVGVGVFALVVVIVGVLILIAWYCPPKRRIKQVCHHCPRSYYRVSIFSLYLFFLSIFIFFCLH